MIVSDMAGTTRDAVDSYFENQKGKYLFIDTAGMRKKSKVDDRIEKFSVLRATMAIERADVCLILVDANEGVTEQDTKVAGLAHEAGKACIIVVNKWDAIEKDDKTMDHMRQDIRRDLSYMTYAPLSSFPPSPDSGWTVSLTSSTMSMTRHPCALPPACSTPCWLTPPPACSPPPTRDAV